MKKITLNVESLKVESFQTGREDGDRGTIDAAAALLGTRVTRCYSECNACTFTQCRTDERTEIDCFC